MQTKTESGRRYGIMSQHGGWTITEILVLLAIVGGIAALIIGAWLEGRPPSLKEGEIYERNHKPSETVMVMQPLVISNGKSTTTTVIPMWFYFPERWNLKIRKYKSGEWEYATWWVNQETYSATSNGMWFCTTPDCRGEEPKERVER